MALSDDDKEYIKSLGLMTSSRMLRDGGEGSGRSDRRPERGEDLRSVLSRMEHQTSIVSVDMDVADKFASAMVSVIQPVRVTGAVRDIVNPLYDRMRIMNEEQTQIEAQRHIESTLYSSRMLESLNRMDKANAKSSRGIYLAVREFQNAPILKTLSVSMKGLAAVTKFGFGLAFGFKKKKSDSDRIIDAINRQTEWLMTGQIRQQNNIFVRLFREGLVGVPLRRMMQVATGLTLERAQEVEDAKSRGESSSNIGDFVARWLMRNRVTLRGRPAPGMSEGGDSVPGVTKPTNVIIDQNSSPVLIVHDRQRYLSAEGFQNTLLNEIFMRTTREVNQHTAIVTRVGQLLEHDKKVFEFAQVSNEAETKADEKIIKWTKETRDEVRAHRRQTFWMGMMRIGASVISGIAGLAKSIGGILAGLAGGRFLRNLLPGGNRPGGNRPGGNRPGGRFGGIWDNAKGLGKNVIRNPRALLGVGGLAGAGLTMAGDAVGRDTNLGIGLNMAGSVAAGASTGALIGSFIPGIGTVVGGALGGAYGTYRGYMNNRERIHGPVRNRATPAPAPIPAGQMDERMLNQLNHPDLGSNTDPMMDYMSRMTRPTENSSDLDQVVSRLEGSVTELSDSIGGGTSIIEGNEVVRDAMVDLGSSIKRMETNQKEYLKSMEALMRTMNENNHPSPVIAPPNFSRR